MLRKWSGLFSAVFKHVIKHGVVLIHVIAYFTFTLYYY